MAAIWAVLVVLVAAVLVVIFLAQFTQMPQMELPTQAAAVVVLFRTKALQRSAAMVAAALQWFVGVTGQYKREVKTWRQ